jgi:hypothetical protein
MQKKVLHLFFYAVYCLASHQIFNLMTTHRLPTNRENKNEHSRPL